MLRLASRMLVDQGRHRRGVGRAEQVAHQQGAAGAQHPPRLGEEGHRVGDVVQDGVRAHRVEAGVRIGQALGVGELEAHALGMRADRAVLGGDLQHLARQVDAEHLDVRAQRGEQQRHMARTAADVEHAAAGTQLQ